MWREAVMVERERKGEGGREGEGEGVGGRDSLSRTVKGDVPVGGDQPEKGPLTVII